MLRSRRGGQMGRGLIRTVGGSLGLVEASRLEPMGGFAASFSTPRRGHHKLVISIWTYLEATVPLWIEWITEIASLAAAATSKFVDQMING